MSQTVATKIALERADYNCEYCYHKLSRIRNIFDYVVGYHSAYAGGHHAIGRARVDAPDAIIALCSQHHYEVEHAIIKKIEIFALLSKIVGYDIYKKYRKECRWTEEEWEKEYP